MQSYPSPNAVAVGNGGPFYSSNNAQSQHSSCLSNPDELQLTAELTTEITPMMSVTPDGTIPENHVHRGQGQPNISQRYEHEHDHDQNPHLQQSPASLDQMVGHYGTTDGTMAPRKRTKVSRACDECRRKKIRCDATNDQNDDHCFNCKRVGVRCLFSRVPMKRGPSKGYIKELADRVHTLEGAINSGEIISQLLPQNDQTRRGSEDYSPPQSEDNSLSKKRQITSTDFGPYLSQRPLATWNSLPQDTSRNLPHAPSGYASPQTIPASGHVFRESTYSPNSLQTAIWRNEPGQSRRQSCPFEELGPEQPSPKRDVELEDIILDAYYHFIHPTYCLLPHNKSKAATQMLGCPKNLREAIYEALTCSVKDFLRGCSSLLDVRKAAVQYILTSSFEEGTSRPLQINIIYLQTMLLFAIAADNDAFCHPRISGGDYSRSVWISNTISLAYALKLYLFKPQKLKDLSSDSDEKVARRLWWSLYIMDRWNSASTSSPVLIPDTASVLYPDDLSLLGDTLWNLARLSTILGHVTTINTVSSSLPPLSVPMASAYGATVKGELERVRESFLTADCQPLVLMAYWHIRILIELQLVDSEPNDLVDIAANAVSHLEQNPVFDSPLKKHFILLIILTLIDLLEYDETKLQSNSQLELIFEKQLISPDIEIIAQAMVSRRKNQIINPAPISQNCTTDSDHKVDIENLVRLADLATAAGANRESVPSMDNAGKQILSSPFRYYKQLREQVRSGLFTAFALDSAQG